MFLYIHTLFERQCAGSSSFVCPATIQNHYSFARPKGSTRAPAGEGDDVLPLGTRRVPITSPLSRKALGFYKAEGLGFLNHLKQ